MSAFAAIRQGRQGYLLSAPALALYVSLLVIPLMLTLLLSFNVFDYGSGIKGDAYTVEHYGSLLGDPYFYEIFLRTLWISALTTLLCVLIGVPEAYILSRMGTPWRSKRSSSFTSSITMRSPWGPFLGPAAPWPRSVM
mgnify:CR=1 FL=1